MLQTAVILAYKARQFSEREKKKIFRFFLNEYCIFSFYSYKLEQESSSILGRPVKCSTLKCFEYERLN